MAKLDVKKETMNFAMIAFLLIAVLFGMQIMTFVFGNLGATSDILGIESRIVYNETGGHIEGDLAPYTLARSGEQGFSSPVVLTAYNGTDGVLIPAVHYTVFPNGVIRNASEANDTNRWTNVNFTYTFNSFTEARAITDDVANNSLVAIRTYSSQSNTQFTTVAIAITLAILVAVFIFFWKAFMGGEGVGRGFGGGGGKRASGGNLSSGDDRNFT